MVNVISIQSYRKILGHARIYHLDSLGEASRAQMRKRWYADRMRIGTELGYKVNANTFLVYIPNRWAFMYSSCTICMFTKEEFENNTLRLFGVFGRL